MATAAVKAVKLEAPVEVKVESKRPKRIRVKIAKGPNSGQHEVTSNWPLPDAKAIMNHLTKEERSFADCYWYFGAPLGYLVACTETKIKKKEWVKAIVKATLFQLDQREEVEEECLLLDSPAFLAMGNAVFKLTAVEMLDHKGKALPALKQKVIADTKLDAQVIIDVATTKGEEMLEESRRRNQVLQREIIALQQQKNTIAREIQLVPPAWTLTTQRQRNGVDQASVPLRMWGPAGAQQLQFGFTVALRIERWTGWYMVNGVETKCTWRAPYGTSAVMVPMWASFPAPGQVLDIYSFKLDDSFRGALPHFKGHLCGFIGDLPKTVNSAMTIARVKEGFERTMAEVNLSSLLSHFAEWNRELDQFLPPKMLEMLKAGTDRNGSQMVFGRAHRDGSCPADLMEWPQPVAPQVFMVAGALDAPSLLGADPHQAVLEVLIPGATEVPIEATDPNPADIALDMGEADEPEEAEEEQDEDPDYEREEDDDEPIADNE